MKNTITAENVRNILTSAYDNKRRISAWNRGVYRYAIEFLEDLDAEDADNFPTDRADVYALLLDGARNFSDYSWCGCSLIYDADIAERLCTPSELRKTRNGERKPNSSEDWLDVQARALWQAANAVYRAAREAMRK